LASFFLSIVSIGLSKEKVSGSSEDPLPDSLPARTVKTRRNNVPFPRHLPDKKRISGKSKRIEPVKRLKQGDRIGIRGIGEQQIGMVAYPEKRKLENIAADDFEPGRNTAFPDRFDVLLDEPAVAPLRFDENDNVGTATRRLQPQRPDPRKQIENRLSAKVAKAVEQCLPRTDGGRTHIEPRRRNQKRPFRRAGNDLNGRS
jgi:hypothetical protein